MTNDPEEGYARSSLLDVVDLHVEYRQGRRRPVLRAVDGVSLQLRAGETVGLVGESGSGKTTIGRALLGLAPVSAGHVFFDGQEITHANVALRRRLSADLQVVFQDPYSSLNPAATIGQTLTETLRVHQVQRREARSRALEMLQRVGLPGDALDRYPASFSGGQRQRIAIARALMANPRLVICDEPTSALDLSVQAQTLNLLDHLQKEFDLSLLFIAHDLAVVRRVSHRMIVLYRGRVMEEGDATTIYDRPLHPYTRALLAAAPVHDPDEQRARRGRRLAGSSEQPEFESTNSCPFAHRCPHTTDICLTVRPALERADPSTSIACHHWRIVQRVQPLKSGASSG